MGVFYKPGLNSKIYFSYATGNREPNRDNYVDANPNGKQPEYETLHDWEAGYFITGTSVKAGANLYLMNYKNQLALTGEINDVGAPVMVNVDKSYRAGIELQAGYRMFGKIRWDGNATFSINRIRDFTEFVDNWDTWEQESTWLGTTDLAFSPGFTANSQYSYSPFSNLNLRFQSIYVGKQYIDNTSNEDRILDAYVVNNFNADYTVKTSLFENIRLHVNVNNILNEKYESNAWVYSYISEGKRQKMDGYFPQAGINFIMGIDLLF